MPTGFLERTTLGGLLALGLLWLTAASGRADSSFIITNTETSDPAGLISTRVTITNYPPGTPAILFQTQTAPV